jgi:hypothetical protein
MVDPEAIDREAKDGRLFGIVPIRAHAEGAARKKDHVGTRLVTARPIGSEASIAITQSSALFPWIFEMLRPIRLENDQTPDLIAAKNSFADAASSTFLHGAKAVLDKGESDCETALKIEERRKQ